MAFHPTPTSGAWIGPAPWRLYHEKLHPFNWRVFRDIIFYGTEGKRTSGSRVWFDDVAVDRTTVKK